MVAAIAIAHDVRLDEAPKLTDLMIISIGLSGITIPIIITYMSLGRNRDVFSEIGDSVQFFLRRENLTNIDVKNVLIMDGPLNGDFFALDEMCDLHGASGAHLSAETKLRLVPRRLMRRYLNLLHYENDEHLSRRHSWLVGAPALACIFVMFGSHYSGEAMPVQVLAHTLTMLAILANSWTYFVLLRLAGLRHDLQGGVTTRLRFVCTQVTPAIAMALRQQRAGMDEPGRNARSSASRLAEEDPDKQPD